MKTTQIPNATARSSLFSIKSLPSNRCVITREIESQKGYTISTRGEEMNQYDSLIFQSCLYNMKRRNLSPGQMVNLTMMDICSPVSMSDGGREYKKVWECLLRLRSLELRVTVDGVLYIGNILSTLKKSSRSVGYVFNETLTDFIVGPDFTWSDITAKSRITSNTGKWLYDFLNSHKTGETFVGIDYLKRLSGASCTDSEFKRLLKKGLDQVCLSENSKIFNYELQDSNIRFNTDTGNTVNPFI